jgi:antitoxin VapB
MQPRRKQTPITIRSDRAAARLKLLTSGGRSQAEVIEEALERLPAPEADSDDARIERRLGEINALIAAIPPGSIMSMKEFDALEYDENGDLR